MQSSLASLAAGIARNVAAGTRLALFLRVAPGDFRVSAGHFAVLFLFNLLLAVLVDAVKQGGSGLFNTMALFVTLGQVPLLLFACLLVAAVLARRELLPALAVALIAADPLFELVGLVLSVGVVADGLLARPALSLALAWGFVLWSLALSLRALVVFDGWRGWPSWRASAILTALVLAFVFFVPATQFWMDEDVSAEPVAAVTDEPLFHLQPHLLQEALAQLRPERPGVEDLYFVGVAPYAAQDVFVREVTAVRRMFDRRFHTEGRSLVLANSARTLADLPIATATNLRTVLDRLGRVMNPDEDVLFLFITSHGDAEHELAFDLPPLNLQQLTPSALARMLADSGIRWKVLVVSACYSGGFVEPLRDANTLVITAADDKSTSFGCESGRDYTYFGEAYFRQALADTVSFTDAFERARSAVVARERAEQLSPSSPQIHVGAAIRQKLSALERRLSAH